MAKCYVANGILCWFLETLCVGVSYAASKHVRHFVWYFVAEWLSTLLCFSKAWNLMVWTAFLNPSTNETSSKEAFFCWNHFTQDHRALGNIPFKMALQPSTLSYARRTQSKSGSASWLSLNIRDRCTYLLTCRFSLKHQTAVPPLLLKKTKYTFKDLVCLLTSPNLKWYWERWVEEAQHTDNSL